MYYLGNSDKINKIINSETDSIKMTSEGGQLRSLSPGYSTIKELKEKQGVLPIPCTCGSLIDTTYHEPTKSELIASNICFFCNFWIGWVKKKNQSNIARINGSHYVVGSDNPKAYFKGFGGRKFIIEFDDGRIVETKNLWHQGYIPDHFKEQLPDNAVFIK